MITAMIDDEISCNLNLLRVFLHVAEHRSFKDAAAQVGRSHSAVSNQIKQLEDQLSVQLFYRTTRSVELTRAGEELVDLSRRVLTDLATNLRRVQSADRREHGVSIASSSSISSTFIPPVMQKFSRRYPDVRISVSEMTFVRMASRILDGFFDFGIAANFPLHPALEFRALVTDPLVAVIPKTMPQSRWESITLRDLCELPLVLMTNESVSQKIFMAAVDARGLQLRTLYDGALRPTLLMPLVNAGLGATVIPSAGEIWASHSNVSMVPIVEPSLSREISIVTARGRKLSDELQYLASLLRKEALRWKAARTIAPQPA